MCVALGRFWGHYFNLLHAGKIGTMVDKDAYVLMKQRTGRHRGVYTMTMMDNKRIANIVYHRPMGHTYRLQVIPVDLNLDAETTAAIDQPEALALGALQAVFAHYVMSQFDMGICRVSLSWRNVPQSGEPRPVRELSVFDLSCTPDVREVLPDRKAKYARLCTGRLNFSHSLHRHFFDGMRRTHFRDRKVSVYLHSW